MTNTDIDFDPATFVTRVTVRSVFGDVSRKYARNIATLADPPNWDAAAPTFFKETARVVRDRSSGRFVAPPAVADSRNRNGAESTNGEASNDPRTFQLLERVEWAWSPSESGGIINVLDITKVPSAESARTQSAFVKRVLRKLREEKHDVPHHDACESAETLMDFRYALDRCLQSKFIASWEPGGLDVDEGSYRAVWSRTSGQKGTLVLKAVKKIRYSSEADVIPGLSVLMNLLAPAVTSMLMNHLTFDGPCGYIAYAAEHNRRRQNVI